MDIDRKTAFAVLLDVEKNEAFSNLALNRRIKENQPQNPAFVRELVYGVLKYQLLLDYQLDKLVKSGSKKLKKQDLTLLRMGLYQLTFMDAVPEYAAVSETVQLAKKYARGRENFINAVLRNFIRGGRKLQLPERTEDLVTHLSVAYSTAPWVGGLWRSADRTAFGGIQSNAGAVCARESSADDRTAAHAGAATRGFYCHARAACGACPACARQRSSRDRGLSARLFFGAG